MITGKLPNELESVQQNSQELRHEMQDIDLAHALEVEVETSPKIELPVHTRASALNYLGQCSKAHKSSAIDNIIRPPKQQPVSLTEIKDRVGRIKKQLFITEEEVESVERVTPNNQSVSCGLIIELLGSPHQNARELWCKKGQVPKKLFPRSCNIRAKYQHT